MKKNGLTLLMFIVLFGASLFAKSENIMEKTGGLSETQVSMLYVALFNRASEGEGNRYWQGTGLSMEEMASSMLATSDAQNYFGNSLNTNRAFVEHIYRNTLNKTPSDDPEGIAYWTNLLDSGVSRGTMVSSFVTSATNPVNAGEAQNQFNNRVTVSNYMSQNVEETPSDYATSTSFGFDLTVTSDGNSVTIAMDYIITYVKDPSENYSPKVDAGEDRTTEVNQAISITGIATDSDGNIVGYEWREGTDILATTATLSYVATSVGEHTLTFRATDNNGSSVSDSMVVTVTGDNNGVNLTNGLVAHYEFEGNAKDSSGNGNDGIEHGGVGYSDGVIGKAGSFDGNSYIKLIKSLDDSVIKRGVTVSFYVKSYGTDGHNNGGIVFAQYNWGYSGHIFGIGTYDSKNESINGITASYYKDLDGSNSDTISTYILKYRDRAYYDENYNTFLNKEFTLEKWHHIVVNSKDDVIQIWMNNQLVSERNKTVDSYVHNSSVDTFIGNIQVGGEGSNNHFIGLLDDLKVYNRALNETEIQALYELGDTTSTANSSSITGKVQDAINSNPIVNANIKLYKNGTYISQVETDSSGIYTIPNLAGESGYSIEISKVDYLTVNYQNIELEANVVKHLETVMHIEQSYAGEGDASGQITNSVDGKGVSGLLINFRKGINVHSGTIVRTETTGSDGL